MFKPIGYSMPTAAATVSSRSRLARVGQAAVVQA
jgi:hypothetical protein